MKIFYKSIFLLLVLLNFGGVKLTADTLTEFRGSVSASSEDLSVAEPRLLVYCENHFREILEIFEKYRTGNVLFFTCTVGPGSSSKSHTGSYKFERDLRKTTGNQIFPEHFFL